MLPSLQGQVTGSHKINKFVIGFLIWCYPIFSFFLMHHHHFSCTFSMQVALIITAFVVTHCKCVERFPEVLVFPLHFYLGLFLKQLKVWISTYKTKIFLKQLTTSHIAHIVSNFPSTLSSSNKVETSSLYNFVFIKFTFTSSETNIYSQTTFKPHKKFHKGWGNWQ